MKTFTCDPALTHASSLEACRTLDSAVKLCKGHARAIAISLDVSDAAALLAQVAAHDLVIRYALAVHAFTCVTRVQPCAVHVPPAHHRGGRAGTEALRVDVLRVAQGTSISTSHPTTSPSCVEDAGVR